MRRKIYIGMLATATAVSLVACSSSGGKSTASGGASSASSATPIKVLATGEYTGTGFGYPEMADGAKAAVAAANAAGGINGHQIELTTCDDKGDPNVAAACARQAVNEKAVAVLGSIGLFAGSITPLLEAGKIAYIGALPVAAQDTSSPIAYPIDGGVPVGTTGQVLGLIRSGCTKIGIMATNNGTSASSVTYMTKAAQSSGATIVKTEQIPPGAPDFTPYVAAILQSSPNCVAFAVSTTDMVKVITAFRHSSNPNILLSAPEATLPPSIVSALNGSADGIQGASGAYLAGPQTPIFNAQLKAENPSAPVDNPAEVGWTAATAFIDVAKNITGAITADSVLAQLGKTTALKVETYPAPINFSKTSSIPGNPHLFNTQTLIYVVKGDTFVLNDPKPVDTSAALSSK